MEALSLMNNYSNSAMEFSKKLSQIIEVVTKRIAEDYRQELYDSHKTATGNLAKSIKFDSVKQLGTRFDGIIKLEDYWKYVEYGRRPGKKWPPRDKIRQWIDDKPVIPYPNNIGKTISKDQLAYLICRKIGEKGIAPTNYLRNIIQRDELQIKDYIENELEKYFKDWMSALIINKV